jgi:hypothetical protein
MDQPEQEKTLQVLSGGTSIEAVAGVGTVVLAILALSGIVPIYMTAIASICAGAGLVFGGGVVASRIEFLRSHTGSKEKFMELTGGMSAEFLAGVAGIALGILALIGIAPATLLSAAAIAFGGALLLGTGAIIRLNDLPAFTGHEEAGRWAQEVSLSAAGIQVLVGIASATLGILALVRFDWVILTPVAMLCVGASALLSGASLASRLQAVLHHHVHHW